MAYTTIEKIKELGFEAHQFSEPDFDAFITRVLTEQTELITLQYSAYSAATGSAETVLAMAEKYMTAAELTRILASQSNADAYRELNGQAPQSENLYKTAQQYENKAYTWLAKLGVSKSVANESGGIASAVVVS